MRKNKTPVVITRRDKKMNKGIHLAAFVATGGMSAPVSAARGALNVRYNARTRRLAAEAAEFEQAQVREESRAMTNEQAIAASHDEGLRAVLCSIWAGNGAPVRNPALMEGMHAEAYWCTGEAAVRFAQTAVRDGLATGDPERGYLLTTAGREQTGS